jgi:hypothetical protein
VSGFHGSSRPRESRASVGRRLLPFVIACCWLCGPPRLHAGGGPENVAVVVNADSWTSQELANCYVHWRQIPPTNVIYLRGLPNFERTDVDTLREKILAPIFKTLFERNVLDHIDYVVYSSDFPTEINATKDIGGAKMPQHLAPTGSITGLTYLYQLVLSKDPRYITLFNNFYTRRPLRDVQSPPLSTSDGEAITQAQQLIKDNKWEEATRAMGALVERAPGQRLLLYDYACCLARTGQADAALKNLELAVDAGWLDAKRTKEDPDLESLRSLPAFKALLKKMDDKAQEPIEVQPATGFRSKYAWDPQGKRLPKEGMRYVLSTMLAVTSGRGNSLQEALSYLQRSVAADATHPHGTVYFMDIDKEVRAQTRRWAFSSAAKALEGTALRGEIINTPVPDNKNDVAGAVAGTAGFDWKKSGSTILAGAICEHLTSFGGAMLEGAGQTPLTEFLRCGAAGSSGTVVEPMSVQAKFPDAFMHVHYARGASLAEAFYQALHAPYQLLIVGDALCQPWAAPVPIEVPELQPGQQVKGTVTFTPRATNHGGSAPALDHFELFLDGQQLPANAGQPPFTMDTNVLGDGWHELRVVAVAAGPLETQSRVILPLVVANQGGAVTLAREPGAGTEVTYGEPLVVRTQAPSAASIAVVHNGRVVGTFAGADGTVSLDTRTLGLGPIALQASTRLATRTSFSAPLEITVVPPPALKAVTGETNKKLVDGLELSVDGGKPASVTDTKKDAQWLATLAPEPDKPIKLNAYFSVPADDMYQFQFEGNSVSTISVDGNPIWSQAAGAEGPVNWTMVPVHLEKGLHRFTLDGKTVRTPSLQIRFGGPGCTSLNGARFRHYE